MRCAPGRPSTRPAPTSPGPRHAWALRARPRARPPRSRATDTVARPRPLAPDLAQASPRVVMRRRMGSRRGPPGRPVADFDLEHRAGPAHACAPGAGLARGRQATRAAAPARRRSGQNAPRRRSAARRSPRCERRGLLGLVAVALPPRGDRQPLAVVRGRASSGPREASASPEGQSRAAAGLTVGGPRCWTGYGVTVLANTSVRLLVLPLLVWMKTDLNAVRLFARPM